MQFKIIVSYADGSEEPWEEEYVENIEDPEAWGKETVEFYNTTLRPGERARKFIRAEIIDPDAMPDENDDQRYYEEDDDDDDFILT